MPLAAGGGHGTRRNPPARTWTRRYEQSQAWEIRIGARHEAGIRGARVEMEAAEASEPHGDPVQQVRGDEVFHGELQMPRDEWLRWEEDFSMEGQVSSIASA